MWGILENIGKLVYIRNTVTPGIINGDFLMFLRDSRSYALLGKLCWFKMQLIIYLILIPGLVMKTQMKTGYEDLNYS